MWKKPSTKKWKRTTKENLFPLRLHDMLDDAAEKGHSHIVSWSNDGMSFRIYQPDAMIPIMAKYFRQTRFKSFLRQLQGYNFTRQPKRSSTIGQNIFSHPYFQRCRRDLCDRIQRKTSRPLRKKTTQNNFPRASLLSSSHLKKEDKKPVQGDLITTNNGNDNGNGNKKDSDKKYEENKDDLAIVTDAAALAAEIITKKAMEFAAKDAAEQSVLKDVKEESNNEEVMTCIARHAFDAAMPMMEEVARNSNNKKTSSSDYADLDFAYDLFDNKFQQMQSITSLSQEPKQQDTEIMIDAIETAIMTPSNRKNASNSVGYAIIHEKINNMLPEEVQTSSIYLTDEYYKKDDDDDGQCTGSINRRYITPTDEEVNMLLEEIEIHNSISSIEGYHSDDNDDDDWSAGTIDFSPDIDDLLHIFDETLPYEINIA